MITGFSPEQKKLFKLMYPERTTPLDRWEITVTQGGDGMELIGRGGTVTIRLGDTHLLGRALSLIEAHAPVGDFTIRERSAYKNLGLMVDCSRGAVPAFTSFCELIRILSRMGYTVVQLYMEDTFALEGHPYFGYRRGGYSKEELKAMDSYAAGFGIELIPAVQTLAHLAQSLQWPAFRDYVDTGDILLVGEERVEELLDSIFATLSQCFTSRRINIGMDEAHMLGLGKYLDKHGYQDRVGLMLTHLERVVQLAQRHGLEPMLWSDMFFRLAAGGDYYAADCTIDPRVAQKIPKGVSLLYWDYYSETSDIYDRMMEKHKQLTKNIIFAGGAWKWMGFSPNNGFSQKLAKLAHPNCLRHGIDEVLLTSWGDNGSECSLFAVLPTLQYWAELCYADQADTDDLRLRFAASCGGVWEQFEMLDLPMQSPNNPAPGRCSVNPQRYALYQDILEGIFDAHIEPESYSAYYRQIAHRLEDALPQVPPQWRYLFETQLKLCRVLAIKCRCGLDIRAAYGDGDRGRLTRYSREILPALQQELDEFIRCFHRQWLRDNRPAGLASFDLRIGGLQRRVGTAIERLEQYLSGDVTRLEELETPLLTYDGKEHTPEDMDIQGPFWHHIASPYDLSSI